MKKLLLLLLLLLPTVSEAQFIRRFNYTSNPSGTCQNNYLGVNTTTNTPFLCMDGWKAIAATGASPSFTNLTLTGMTPGSLLYAGVGGLVSSSESVRVAESYAGATVGAKIAAAIADLPATGGTVDARGLEGAQTLSATLTIDKPVHLLCNGSASTYTLADGVDDNIIEITSDNVTIENCTIDGNKANQTAGHAIAVDTAVTDLTLRGNTVQNIYGRALSITKSVNRMRITDNIITNAGQSGNDAAIYYAPPGSAAAFDSQDWWITRNKIDQSDANRGGIKIAAEGVTMTGSGTISNLHIDNNTVIVGDAGATDTLGIELYTANGGTIREATVSNNTVSGENATNANIYGISIGGESANTGEGGFNISVTGNVILDARDLSIELIGNSISASGNTIIGSGEIAILGSSKVGGDLNSGISATGNTVINPVNISFVFRVDGLTNGLSEVTISANTVSSPSVGTIGIDVKGSVVDSIFSDNTFSIGAGSGVGFAVGASATFQKIIIANNSFDLTGTATANGDGININHSSGTKNDIQILGNYVKSPTRYGIHLNGAPTDVVISNNIVNLAGDSGIRTSAAADQLTVTNNYVYDSVGTGIIFAGSPTNVTYFGNKLQGNATNENLGAATYANGSTHFALRNVSGQETTTFSATPAFNAALGNSFAIVLTNNVTSCTITNARAGQEIVLIVKQSAGGANTFACANLKGLMTISGTANTINVQSFIYYGTETDWFATSSGVVGMTP